MITVAIHQPNYLPNLGFFYKMAKCDIFIYLDDALYSKNGFINRNRIKTAQGELWLTVPLLSKGHSELPINKMEINHSVGWRRKHKMAIEQSYSKATYWGEYKDDLCEFYEEDNYTYLPDISIKLAEWIRQRLGMKCVCGLSSSLNIRTTRSQRLIDICKVVDAGTYYSGMGARNYLDEGLFEKAGIKLVWMDFHHPVYPQLHKGFLPNMSAIDLLLNCGGKSLEILRSSK